jgi:hypothetical protein
MIGKHTAKAGIDKPRRALRRVNGVWICLKWKCAGRHSYSRQLGSCFVLWAGLRYVNMAAPSSVSAAPTASPLFLREHEVRRGVELLFFGYTRLTRAIDDGLAEMALAFAPSRQLYRPPTRPISELLKIRRSRNSRRAGY